MARGSAEGTRRKILDAAYRLFYRRGFGRVGMDEIAAQAGLTKRTLYYHYPSKDDLLKAVLEDQHELAMARILKDGRGYSGKPRNILSQRFADFRLWTATRGWTGSGFSRLVMELADLPGHPARRMARRHKQEMECWLAGELAKAGDTRAAESAKAASILMEGAMVMVLITGDQDYAALAARMAAALEGDWPPPLTP